MKAPAVVIGIGNGLMGDDSVGLALIRVLQEEGMPAGVELLDIGVPDVGLLEILGGRKKAVLVDAMQAGLAPGTVKTFTREQLPVVATIPWSLHGFGLLDVLQLGYLLQPDKMPPSLWLVGIQAGEFIRGVVDLSPAVAAALPQAATAVRKLIAGGSMSFQSHEN